MVLKKFLEFFSNRKLANRVELQRQREEEAKQQEELQRQREEEAKRQEELQHQLIEEAKQQEELQHKLEEEAKRQEELRHQREEEAKRQKELQRQHKEAELHATMQRLREEEKQRKEDKNRQLQKEENRSAVELLKYEERIKINKQINVGKLVQQCIFDTQWNNFEKINCMNNNEINMNPISPEVIRSFSYGEVKHDSYRATNHKKNKDGLFSESIFGHVNDWDCCCGKYKGVRDYGIKCDICGVLVSHSNLRKERIGHIELLIPIVSNFYKKTICVLLDISNIDLNRIISHTSYIDVNSENSNDFKQEIKEFGVHSSLNVDEKQTGSLRIIELLKNLNLQSIADTLNEEKKTNGILDEKKTIKHKMVCHFLENNIKPEWLVSTVLPVIPIEYRDETRFDSNHAYRKKYFNSYAQIIKLNTNYRINNVNFISKSYSRELQYAVSYLLDIDNSRFAKFMEIVFHMSQYNTENEIDVEDIIQNSLFEAIFQKIFNNKVDEIQDQISTPQQKKHLLMIKNGEDKRLINNPDLFIMKTAAQFKNSYAIRMPKLNPIFNNKLNLAVNFFVENLIWQCNLSSTDLNKYLKTAIEELNLDVNIINKLKHMGVNFVQDFNANHIRYMEVKDLDIIINKIRIFKENRFIILDEIKRSDSKQKKFQSNMNNSNQINQTNKINKYIFSSRFANDLINFMSVAATTGYGMDIKSFNPHIIIDIVKTNHHALLLNNVGTVYAFGNNYDGQCNTGAWNNIIEIAACNSHSVGLKKDGNVITTGKTWDGPYDVVYWENIITIIANENYTIGFKQDGNIISTHSEIQNLLDKIYPNQILDIKRTGAHFVFLREDRTVLAFGNNDYGQCNVFSWKDISQVAVSDFHTVALKVDGTVIATGENNYGQCNVLEWNNIIEIIAGDGYTVGLKKDGTVVAVGYDFRDFRPCDVSAWTNIVKISSSGMSTIGIKEDGTVVMTITKNSEIRKATNWTNIDKIEASYSHIVGLTKNGTVIATGCNHYNECNVSHWKDIKQLVVGRCFTIGLTKNGTLLTTTNAEDEFFSHENITKIGNFGNNVWAATEVQIENVDFEISKDKFSDSLIEELDLSLKTFNCLNSAGINTVKQLSNYAKDDMLNIRNLTKRCVEEITNKLEKFDST